MGPASGWRWLSPRITTTQRWWVRRSGAAPADLGLPKTSGHAVRLRSPVSNSGRPRRAGDQLVEVLGGHRGMQRAKLKSAPAITAGIPESGFIDGEPSREDLDG
jgi:hypothetical protein